MALEPYPEIPNRELAYPSKAQTNASTSRNFNEFLNGIGTPIDPKDWPRDAQGNLIQPLGGGATFAVRDQNGRVQYLRPRQNYGYDKAEGHQEWITGYDMPNAPQLRANDTLLDEFPNNPITRKPWFQGNEFPNGLSVGQMNYGQKQFAAEQARQYKLGPPPAAELSIEHHLTPYIDSMTAAEAAFKDVIAKDPTLFNKGNQAIQATVRGLFPHAEPGSAQEAYNRFVAALSTAVKRGGAVLAGVPENYTAQQGGIVTSAIRTGLSALGIGLSIKGGNVIGAFESGEQAIRGADDITKAINDNGIDTAVFAQGFPAAIAGTEQEGSRMVRGWMNHYDTDQPERNDAIKWEKDLYNNRNVGWGDNGWNAPALPVPPQEETGVESPAEQWSREQEEGLVPAIGGKRYDVNIPMPWEKPSTATEYVPGSRGTVTTAPTPTQASPVSPILQKVIQRQEQLGASPGQTPSATPSPSPAAAPTAPISGRPAPADILRPGLQGASTGSAAGNSIASYDEYNNLPAGSTFTWAHDGRAYMKPTA